VSPAPTGPVLVTGCSSGIGRAAALALVEADHTVYASARRPEALADLATAGARVLALDVTSEASMVDAVRAIEREHGRVGALVNNAGYGEYGTIEETDLDKVRTMFETNVFGLARLTQLVLPAMREAREGRIVNIGSMGGRLTFPVGGYYHATKYAVEALSDALRNEVRAFGIGVSLIEPGLIRTEFGSTALTSGAAVAQHGSPYAALVAASASNTTGGYGSAAITAGPESVAKVIRRAIESRHPRPRYVVTPTARVLIATRRFGGDRLWDLMVRAQFNT
jgi:NADP-dependent 3-hydroxy acid dehydrogenase YdfG